MGNNKGIIKDKRIVVLSGGWNGECDVSRSSGDEVFKSLVRLGYEVFKLEFDQEVASKLVEMKPDVVFNALHGRLGEDGSVQGLLDILGISYTHSGLLASAICMDKVAFRKICDYHDVLVPPFDILKKGNDKENRKIINLIKKPFVIKPINEGSSIGVEIILSDTDFDISKYDWKYGDEMIIEKYIKGKELNVAILGDEAIGCIQVVPRNSLFYDYKSKYTVGMTDYIIPDIDSKKNKELLELSLYCHRMAGCKDISRVEFLLSDDDDKLYLLEINTQPGITPLSLVPKIAKRKNISFDSMIESLIDGASCNK